MPDLRVLGQQVVDQPFRQPTSVAALQSRALTYTRRRNRRLNLAAAGVTVAMIALLIGVARSASSTPRGSMRALATTTSSPEQTSTTLAANADATTLPSESSTT